MTIINIGIVVLMAYFIPKATQTTTDDAPKTETNRTKASLVELRNAPSLAAKGSPAMSSTFASNAAKAPSEIRAFIHDLSEARIMDLEEGKLAAQRGTNRPLKDYGTMMIEDQTKMLQELQKIASLKNVEIASELGRRKTVGLSDLHELHGKEFDSKFIRMMIIDHKRDIRKLEKATKSRDADVQVFATKYLPVVKNHLTRIEEIKEEMKK